MLVHARCRMDVGTYTLLLAYAFMLAHEYRPKHGGVCIPVLVAWRPHVTA